MSAQDKGPSGQLEVGGLWHHVEWVWPVGVSAGGLDDCKASEVSKVFYKRRDE